MNIRRRKKKMIQKYRAQILLEPEQHNTLQEIAHREGHSISEVAREVIRLGLQALEMDSENLWAKRMVALEELSQLRQEIQEERGTYQGNLVDEARDERKRQLDNPGKAE
jgi:heterodisulfide reductase subunit C